jgi:hypothetical protein
MLALTLWSCSQLENAQREAQVTLMTTMMIAVACAAAAAAAVWFVFLFLWQHHCSSSLSSLQAVLMTSMRK